MTVQEGVVTILDARAVATPVTRSNPMDMKGKFPNGLERLMRRHGDGPTKLARAIDTSKQNVNRWAEQSRKLPLEWAEKIAGHYSVPVAEVMLPDGGGSVSAPLISWVSAGALVTSEYVEEMDSARKVAAIDLNPAGRWVALKVDGDSMDRISPPESIIFVDLTDRRLVPNACYVIADEHGGATYKRWRPSPERWEPVSTNPEHEPHFVKPGQEPRIIGRVYRTMLDM